MKKANSRISKTYADYVASKKANTITTVSLSVAVVILLAMNISKDEIIVMVPPNITEDAVIVNGKANGEYQKRFALPLAIMIGNTSYQNVDFVNAEIRKMFSPFLVQNVEQKLINEARIFKARELQQSFVVEDMIYSDTQNIVWVWGSKTLKGKGRKPLKENYTFEFQVTSSNGYPRVTHFKGYDGHPNSSKIISSSKETKTQYYTEEQLSLAEGLEVVTPKREK
jgi:hypothetical protein|tara:strand:- start:7097 stop:7771 length:675 start_codon:yes stop_codon:yes gene_type:complete